MDKKQLWMGLFAIMFVLLTGCQTSGGHTIHMPTKDEVVETHGRIENLERLDTFVNYVNKGKRDKVRLIRYTIEGDPIYHDLSYTGSKLTVSVDTTEDQYGGGEVNTYQCKGIKKEESNTKTQYILDECPNIGEILTIEHDVDRQDRFDFELKYGVGMKNLINTKEQNLVKDLQNGETAAVSDFQFSKEELNNIYKQMILANYLEEKHLSKSCNKKPYVSYELTVWINDGKQHFSWSECDKSEDGKEMSALVSDILAILKNNPVYQTLPEVKGAYE